MRTQRTGTGARLFRPWRVVFLCCLALLLALDDNASCWRLALEGASGRGQVPSAPEDNDEEVLVKHAQGSAGAYRRGRRLEEPVSGGPAPLVLAPLTSARSSLAQPSPSVLLQTP